MGEQSDYQFWLSMGICPQCHKQKIAPGRHACVKCLGKRKAYNKKRSPSYYRDLPDERKQAIKDRMKAKYDRRKALGICVCCTKPATHGVFCEEHWRKMQVSRTKHNRKIGIEPVPPRQKLKVPKHTNRCQVDVGKIIALYNAGWKYDDIKDEMRISQSTVGYWIKKAKEDTNADIR